MSGSIVVSLLEASAPQVAARLRALPGGTARVEIRADALGAGDVEALVRAAPLPAIVTVREPKDGGSFAGTPERKRAILSAALRAGAFAVDVEWDGPLRDLAFGPEASRVIVSHHGAPCTAAALDALFDRMAAAPVPRLKIVPHATHPSEIAAIAGLLERARRNGRALAAFATGRAGMASRILAPSWGSWATYGSIAEDRATAEGQTTADDLASVFRVDAITESTRRFALFGSPVATSPSPAIHAAGYRALGLDAVYIPVDTDDVEEIVRVASSLHLSGFAVTVPLKSAVAARCVSLDRAAECGAVNSVVCGSDGWHGFNTDGPAASALLAARVPLEGAAVAIAGAGGTARAIGAALGERKARVTFHGRDPERTAEAARRIGAAAARWDALPAADWDILVQATPLGAGGEVVLPAGSLRGRAVFDAAYGAAATPLVRAARARGLSVVDGGDLLLAQALLQFEILTGRPAPRSEMAAARARRIGTAPA